MAIGEYNLYTQTVPINIVLGPDNAMWFTGLGNPASGSVVGRMSPSGQFTEWNVEYTAYRYAITSGPDGALWFTEGSTGNIGRITTAGQITQFPLPTKYTTTFGIVAGPDGALWFTEGIANKIGRMTTAGVVTEYALSNATNPRGAARLSPPMDSARMRVWHSTGTIRARPLATVVADIYGNVTFGVTVPSGAPVGKNGVFGRGESTSAIGPGSFMVQ